MLCDKCGENNPDDVLVCAGCGQAPADERTMLLEGPPAPPPRPTLAPPTRPQILRRPAASPSSALDEAPPAPRASGAPPARPTSTNAGAASPHPARTPGAPAGRPTRGVELASGRAWVAALAADAALTVLVTASACIAVLIVLGVRPAPQPIIDYAHASPAGALVVLLGVPFVVVGIAQALPVALFGATIGHMAFDLRVVSSSTGQPLSRTRAAVRGLTTALGVLCFGAGPLWGLLVDGRRRGLGDVLAGSIVVCAQDDRQ